MECIDRNVLVFLEGLNRYKIPIYQRCYSWDEAQWSRLFDDILTLRNENADEEQKHFLGFVVLTSRTKGESNYEYQYVVDGQQRIITLSVLLKAIYDAAQSSPSREDSGELDGLYYNYLIYQTDATDNRSHVQPVGDDFIEYKKLFSEHPGEGNSRIARCYRYFRGRLQTDIVDEGKNLRVFYGHLSNLYFMVLVLSKNDDAQVIFETINATGIALTESDKIRNFILMKYPPDLQRRYHDDYWEKIEKNTGNDINNFIRYYLMAAKGIDARIKSLYQDFKAVWGREEVQKDIESTFVEILRYSEVYREVTVPEAFPYNPRSELSKIVYRLTKGRLLRLASPFLLRAIDYCHAAGREQDIEPILSTIESLLVRRMVCKINKNSDTSLFKPLHSRVMQIVEEENRSYPEALEIALLRNRRTSRFPSDEEFKENFLTLGLYKLPKEMQRYFIARLEAGDSKVGEMHREVLEKLENSKNSSTYSIEHIMPRKLNSDWEQELGSSFEEVHEKYLHTPGNITITAYNSSYSNKSFREKKTCANGFNSSPIRLSASLKNVEHWDERAILDRAESLFEKALTLWPRKAGSEDSPKVEKRPLNLNDDFTFTSLKRYQYRGKSVRVDSWADAMTKLLVVLQEVNPDNFSLKEEDPENWRNQISNTDTNTKIRHVKRLFRRCGLDESDLIFFVEQKKESDDDVNLLDFNASFADGDDEEGFDEPKAPYGGAPLDD